MADEEFLTAFENCTLPFKCWTHRAHVRVAYLYAAERDLHDAIDQMRSGIKAYNHTNNVPEAIDQGYHETITQAFMRMVYVANRLTGPHRSSDDFCRAHPELLDKFAMRQFYSKNRIVTMRAKGTFVEPDLMPLPVVVNNSLTFINAIYGAHLKIARDLFTEFAQSLDFDLCFQNFDAELACLPGAYAPPSGRLMIAFHHNWPAGCVALRPLDRKTCEMKRLWLRPDFRRIGLGRHLAKSIITEARNIGYTAMRLDTVPSMKAAIGLYRSLGFVQIESYTDNPTPGALFMEIRL